MITDIDRLYLKLQNVRKAITEEQKKLAPLYKEFWNIVSEIDRLEANAGKRILENKEKTEAKTIPRSLRG